VNATDTGAAKLKEVTSNKEYGIECKLLEKGLWGRRNSFKENFPIRVFSREFFADSARTPDTSRGFGNGERRCTLSYRQHTGPRGVPLPRPVPNNPSHLFRIPPIVSAPIPI